jgi:hypothetical protein
MLAVPAFWAFPCATKKIVAKHRKTITPRRNMPGVVADAAIMIASKWFLTFNVRNLVRLERVPFLVFGTRLSCWRLKAQGNTCGVVYIEV